MQGCEQRSRSSSSRCDSPAPGSPTRKLAERRRIERNLHDGAQQRLLAVALQLQAAHLNGRPDRLRETIRAGVSEIQAAVLEPRELPTAYTPPSSTTAASSPPSRTSLPARRSRSTYGSPSNGSHPRSRQQRGSSTAKRSPTPSSTPCVAAIVVGIERRDGTLVIEVSDDGIGGADPSGSGLRGHHRPSRSRRRRTLRQPRPGRGTIETSGVCSPSSLGSNPRQRNRSRRSRPALGS